MILNLKFQQNQILIHLYFQGLGVQDEENAEHIVKVLQDRGFLVLKSSYNIRTCCNKYDSAVLISPKKGNIPQPNFCLMTKDILFMMKNSILKQ